MTLHLDYETRSRINLLEHGAYIYAQDPSTEIICMAWAFDDEPVALWVPGEKFPTRVNEAFFADKPRSLHAHNSQFERLITKFVHMSGAPDLAPTINNWYCTAAQARRRALPGGLDKLGRALKLDVQKSMAGKQLIRKLCIPWLNGTIDWENGEFNYDPELLKQMGEYCVQDVEVERAAALMTPALTDAEFAEFVVSEKINDRGILVDVELALAAMSYAEDEITAIGAELSKVTIGKIDRPRQFARLKEYLEPYMEADNDLRRIMTKHKTERKTGVTKVSISLDKSARLRILGSPEDFDARVIELVSLIDDAARSSVSKFKAMGLLAGADDRVRGAYLWCGASQTGRWSSTGLQLHNFTRDCADDPDDLRAAIIDDYELADPLNELASMLRPAIIAPPGETFVCGDLSSIEAVVLPWLSDTFEGDAVLDAYEAVFNDDTLPDMYTQAATDMGSDDRQMGKIAVLSCIAAGQLVLTDVGGIAIEDVTVDMKVWDGVKFVSHEGSTYRGYKEVIEYDGITATPDHIVWGSISGPCKFGQAAARGENIVQSGTGGEAIWVGEDPHAGTPLHKRMVGTIRKLRMRGLWPGIMDILRQPNTGEIKRLSILFAAAATAYMVDAAIIGGKTPLRKQDGSGVQGVRRAWHTIPFQISERGWHMGHSFAWFDEEYGVRSYKQRRALRTRELKVVYPPSAKPEYQTIQRARTHLREIFMALREKYGDAQTERRALAENHTGRGTPSSNKKTQKLAIHKGKAHTYDLVNAGPLHRFTVSGKLVHNCGFQGGFKAVQGMARNYGVEFTKDEATAVKDNWRSANMWAVDLWAVLDAAVMQAMRSPGEVINAARVSYVYQPEWDALYCVLPSGKTLSYPQPLIEMVKTPWGQDKQAVTCIKAAWAPAAGSNDEWPRIPLYGGMLAENATQAVAAEILGWILCELDRLGYGADLHTHDEALISVRDDEVEETVGVLEHVMTHGPAWSGGLPLACSIWAEKRYRK